MISIIKKKKSSKLYVQYYIDDKCIQRSTKLDDTLTNRKFIEKQIIPSLELKILKGEFNKREKQKDFSFFAEKYLKSKDALKTYSQLSSMIHNQILPTFKNRDVESIKRFEIKDFAEEKLLNASPKRVKMILNVVASVIDIAIDYEVLSVNVAKSIPLPSHEKKEFEPFSTDEVSLLLSKSSGWFQAFLAISFYTGARTGEVLALNWNDINLENKTISITKGLRNGIIDKPKTKSSVREVPIFEPLVKYIKEHRSNSRSIAVFLNPHTGKMFYKSAKLTPIWTKLLQDCNLKHRILYSTRHTFISTMLKNSNLSMLDIAQIVGHSNTEMIIRNYAKFIKGEHLKINRYLDIFSDNLTDTNSKMA